MDFDKFKNQIVKQMVESFKTKEQYKSLGVKNDELLKLFKTFIEVDFLKEFPTFKTEIESDTSIEVWNNMLRGKFLNYAKKKYSKTSLEGKFYPLGITEPFDYLVALKNKQKNIIKDLLADRAKGKKIEDDLEKLVSDGFCNRDLTKLYDNRKNDKGELKRKNKDGSPMEWANSAFLSTMYGLFEYKDETGKIIDALIVQTIGGEFGDKIINPTCTKCSKQNYKRVCECGTEKPEFIVEFFMRNIGKECEVIMQKDQKTGNITFDSKKSTFDKVKDLNSVEKEALFQKIMKVIEKDYLVTGSTMPKWYNLYEKNRKAFCVYRAFVADKFDRINKMNCRTIIFNDEDLLASDRLSAFIPAHVFDFNLDRVRIDSDVVIIGTIMKFNQKQGQQSSNYSNSFPYSIKVAGVLVMRNEKPIVIEADVIKDKVSVASITAATKSQPSQIEKDLQEFKDMQSSADESSQSESTDNDLEKFLNDSDEEKK